MFIGLPFVVRTLQPALEDLDPEIEEAAASLGAGRLATFRRVILPSVLPALLAGFALALARGLGEYGSVVFIAGNRVMETEITPFLIITKLEQYDYAGATAIGVVMLTASFLLLLIINLLAMVEPPLRGRDRVMAHRDHHTSGRLRRAARGRSLTTEPPLVRRLLIGTAVAFLTLFLLVPLVAVFWQAFGKGVSAYFAALADPDTLSAIRLTLLTAAVCVPLGTVFGVAAAWTISKFDFLGKNLLITLIDLPFSVSPVIAGLIFVLLFGWRAGLLGPWLAAHDIKIVFAVPGIILATLFVTVPVRRPRADPLDASPGDRGGRGRPRAGGRRLADLLARHGCRTSSGGCSTASSSATPGRWANSAPWPWCRAGFAA